MKWSLSSVLATGIAAIFFTGCATIFKGTSQTVSVLSNVKGAEIIVDGKRVGTTPYSGPIPRGSSTTMTIRKDGYETKTIALNTEVEPVFWGNGLLFLVYFLGSFTSSTDYATGSMYKYSPATISVDLDKASGN